ncbi:group IIE secretory phospholipase A2 isoform X3 [Erinaceus europaeus]|uniref:Phospholipase A2 n=1 Tax=Erinaceus europaeus TaxID=9365 RepID=A0ABM3Y776_ERIEU|nr:group IIE secretory phospholipase A2 isoform X3 [Erinaceus europaeus]
MLWAGKRPGGDQDPLGGSGGAPMPGPGDAGARLRCHHGAALADGNLVQFGVMIERMTGKSALQYNDYGCYCGLGGAHWPVDATDWCCHAHDCCYGRLEKLGCEPKFERYLFSTSKDDILCEQPP